MSNLKKYTGLFGWIVLCALAGAIGAYFKPGRWYQMLAKPAFNPPAWVFGVVWPVLYVLMAVAAWLIWKEYGFDNGGRALKWFGAQLVLNAAWSGLFFGRHSVNSALAEIILLWVALLFTLILFGQRNKIAGGLLIPYQLLVSFAVILNFAIWQLN